MQSEVQRAKATIKIDELQKKLTELQEKYDNECSANEYAANHYGSECCAGGMIAAERGILEEITGANEDIGLLQEYLNRSIEPGSENEETLRREVKNIERGEAMLSKRKEAIKAILRQHDRISTLLA